MQTSDQYRCNQVVKWSAIPHLVFVILKTRAYADVSAVYTEQSAARREIFLKLHTPSRHNSVGARTIAKDRVCKLACGSK